VATNLEFGHIDWKNGSIAVSGKSRRAEWLPLTQEVGDAIIACIERARSRVR
jgi:integrase/recombinase XerD